MSERSLTVERVQGGEIGCDETFTMSREYWSTVSVAMRVKEAEGALKYEEIETLVWRILIVVRNQDPQKGVNLHRHCSKVRSKTKSGHIVMITSSEEFWISAFTNCYFFTLGFGLSTKLLAKAACLSKT